MTVTSVSVQQERRKSPRSDARPRFEINLLHPHHAITAGSVNFSEGGLCLRIREMLEVRSLVRLQVTSDGGTGERPHRPVQCAGRVRWVVQRLDLSNAPPFLYDIGIEFIDPPLILRQLMVQHGAMAIEERVGRSPRERSLASALIHGREFVPRLERILSRPLPWHLVVAVNGTPCFSHHYPSERAALAAWAHFKRQEARR